MASVAFTTLRREWGVVTVIGTNSSCEQQSQECFVVHDIFPRVNILLPSIRETFKRSSQGLVPERVILYCFNVRGEEQKVYFIVTIKVLETLREKGIIPFVGQGNDACMPVKSASFDTTIAFFLSPTPQRSYFFSLLSQNGPQDSRSSALSDSASHNMGPI